METCTEKHKQNKRMKKYAFGGIVIAAGLLLLAFNAELLPYSWKHVLFSWQMLLIAIGVVSLFGKENHLPGFILIAVGSFFLIPEIFHDVRTQEYFWPVILIALGILVLSKSFRRHHFGMKEGEMKSEEGYINEENVFAGSKQKLTHQQFRGGKISCVFGGSEVDLTQASLAPGEHVLELNMVFGGVELIVPADWKIILKNSSVLGGFSDKRSIVRDNPDPSKVLIIKANAVFGGGEIKSY
ncbi:MAG: hypothetical protein FJY10_11590 [Bacteroidetes bacterium]|nr:hypothetical protein [Bacteroidota bacterium]